MKLRSLVIGLLAAALPAAQGQEQLSDEEALNRFVGVWTLVHWEETLADGTKRVHPVSAGHIIYSDIGRMCAVVMDPNRPKWQSATPTPEEALAGMNSRAFYAYCATAEMHAAEGYVLHHTVIDKVPNAVGAVRKRWFNFEGPDRVVLRIDPAELADPIVESVLLWERVVDERGNVSP